VLTLAAGGCSGGDPPESPSPGPGTGETITGRERIGWDQQAADAAELATFRYAIYVDGVRSEMTGATCAASAGTAGFACTAPLPPLTPGAHTLELAAFVQTDAVLESARSGAFRVTVTGAAPGSESAATWTTGEAGVTGDGLQLHVERLLDGLQFPSDAAFSPDGRLFIAERAGRIRIVENGQEPRAPALALEDLAAGGSLLALALDPDFSRTRQVFTLSTTTSSRGLVFRLTRYRELRGVLAQRAVLLESPAAVPSGALRFGPDGMLYVALGGAAQESPASYGGKILRLQPDGRAPRDRRAGLPIFSSGHLSPRGMAWRPAMELLWLADGTPDGVEWIMGISAGEHAVGRATWGLPPTETTSGMSFYDSERIPELRGDLLIASPVGERLMRIKFGEDPLRAEFSEPLLDHLVGPIRVVLPGPDGAIYFCTDTTLGRLTAGDGR
jgi:glucose/arabinose dehydrogenase